MKSKLTPTLFYCIAGFVTISLFGGCKKESTAGGTTVAKIGFNPLINYGIMTDQEGNVYKTVAIGNQVWMAENLRTTIYNDGTPIPLDTSSRRWAEKTTPAYCNVDNTNNQQEIAVYGRLYNWYVVETGKLAPHGWHVPSEADWNALYKHLGGIYLANLMKEVGTTHWLSPNAGASNASGFTALPSGSRREIGFFRGKGSEAAFWSTTVYPNLPLNAYVSVLQHDEASLIVGLWLKNIGCSVRCIKD